MEDRLVVIDGTNLFYRSYHGLINEALAEGEQPTFAVYGLVNTIANTFRVHHPTHAVVVFDWGKSEYRLAIWPKYKGGRPTTEITDTNDTENQMSICQDLLPKLGLQTWRVFEVEADDLMASVVAKFESQVDEIIVITGDKDMRQLARKNVVIVHPSIGARAEATWGFDEVTNHYGVEPQRLPEVWALSGDKVDNVPGVPGIGEKTAIKLINQYGDLSHVALSSEKKIEGYRHDINMSYRLVQLNAELSEFPLELDQVRFVPTTPNDARAEVLRGTLHSLGFDSLLSRWSNGSLWTERGVRLKDLKKK